jgi:hypothetical protein
LSGIKGQGEKEKWAIFSTSFKVSFDFIFEESVKAFFFTRKEGEILAVLSIFSAVSWEFIGGVFRLDFFDFRVF